MKIYLDSAVVSEVKTAHEMGILDGVTTNPTIIMRAGGKLEPSIRQIASIVDGPVHAEVISQKTADIIREGMKLSKIHPNVVVKIPMTIDGLKAVPVLSSKKIKTNLTLVFSVSQALLGANAGADYVTPFIGRLDDAGQNGIELIQKIVTVFKNYEFKTQVLAASVRTVDHVASCALAGAHIATVPMKVLLEMAKHPLTDAGVAKFLDDWKKCDHN